MIRTILIYGLILAALLIGAKLLEAAVFTFHISLEYYLGIIAICFMALGIYAGTRFRNRSESIPMRPPAPPAQIDFEQAGLSKREFDVLQQLAKGATNKQIAETLFISENTVKTHLSNIYDKLDVKRRTQAVGKAREMGLIG
ncbi:MAG: response regulator transcription factor [Bacteroidota bacterium]